MSSFLSTLWASKSCPREVAAMIKFKLSVTSHDSKITILQAADELSDIDFCYLCLHKVSRSFAVVIQLLDEEIRDAICLFYLVLRGLDSVEDDMEFPIDQREPLLRTFHTVLDIDGWNIKGVGDTDDYRQMLQRFDKVISAFKTLKPEYQEVIVDITKRMGEGMANYAVKDDQNKLAGVETVAEYEEYCHYVAGLVGIGLNRLFVVSRLEEYEVSQGEALANSMGLFLQKTNITRDYLEDYEQQRSWWPKEIWGLYSDDLGFFAKHPHHVRSRLCLNHMILNSLKHIPDVIRFLSLIKNPSIFNFCAIPQVMAIASMSLLFNNVDSLQRTIKIRRGIVCDVAINAIDLPAVKGFFKEYINSIRSRLVHPNMDPIFLDDDVIPAEREKADVLYKEYLDLLDECDAVCDGYSQLQSGWGSIFKFIGLSAATVGGLFYAYSYLSENNLFAEETEAEREARDAELARQLIAKSNAQVKERMERYH